MLRAAQRGQRPPVQMKANALRAPHLNGGGVVQRTITIAQYGTKNKTRTFSVKNSRSKSTYPKSADYLIHVLKKTGFSVGWVKHIRDLVEEGDHQYNTLQDLINEVAKTFPLIEQKKLEKKLKKRKISDQQKTNLTKIKTDLERPGKKQRNASLVVTNKLTEQLSLTNALQQNINDLTSNYKTTNSGGKSLILDTGNLFQSLLALSLANLDDDVKGAYIEGKYNRVNDGGTGNSEGIRKDPFIGIPDRLKYTVVHGDGAYEPNKIVGEELATFENIRLGENTVSSEFRHLLVQEGKLKDTEEFSPISKFALSELAKATTGEKVVNQLMNQNAFRIYEQVKNLDHSTVIGRNSNLLPTGTNTATIGSYVNAYNQVTTNHTQQTQNEYHKLLYYIVRAMYGPFIEENKDEFVPSTPPGSPFDPNYEYDK